jgi:EmrB/QacA subfamily drug resistance transporter
MTFLAFRLDSTFLVRFHMAMSESSETLKSNIGNDPSTRRTAVIIAALTSFMTPVLSSSVNIALPAIEKVLQMDAVLLSWVPTSYLLAAAVFLVPFGRLADIYGRKRIFAYGTAIITVSSFLLGMSFSAFMLVLLRIIQGMGSAMIFATGIAILTSVFPPAERGRVLGINVAAVYAGLSLGPLLGGLLTQYLSWRSVFLIHVPLGMFITFLVYWKLKPEWAGAKGEGFDIQGSLIYGMALVSIMYGISRLPAGTSLWYILFGFLGIGVFVKWEGRAAYPVFDIILFVRNRLFALSCVAALIHYSATFAVTFLLSLYLQYIKGLTPEQAGLILIAQPVMMTIFSPLAGRLSDKIEPRIVASLGMALTTAGLAPFIFLGKDTTIGFIVANLLVLGFGYALFSSPNINAIMGSVEGKFFGLASGSVGTMRLLGMMISMGIATAILTLLMGRVPITPEYYAIFIRCIRSAFTVFSIFCFFGIFSSMARGRLQAG